MKYCTLFTALLFAAGTADALTGKVVDTNGRPIEGAKIEVVGSSLGIVSDENGEFAFDLQSVDEIHVEASGYSHKVLHLHGKHEEALNIVLVPTVIEQVDVIGLPLHASTMESAQPITVVSGDELRKKQASTLGETLKNEVGVHASYFGPVASSPVIRGFDGPRVLITQNGLDVSDASRVGPDHVVATEASTAQQIEILRGPATLFYGSGAIGGVVNVIDDRVPTDSERKGAFVVQHNTVANENEASAAYTGGTSNFAYHIDGFWRDGEDYEIPGIAELETEEEHEEEEHEEHAEGILENSASESQGFNLGASFLFDKGFVGLSYGRLERLNGVPGHGHAEEHHDDEELEGEHDEEEHGMEEHGEEQVLSDLKQDRWQLISELQIDGAFLSAINTRIGYTDYEHEEIHNEEEAHDDEDHEEGEHDEEHEEHESTRFSNQTTQLRVDLLHQEFSGWRGAFSIEHKQVDFEAVGAEAFTPPSETSETAFAIMEEKHSKDILWQLGMRVEQVDLSAESVEVDEQQIVFDDLSFTPMNLSLGLVWDFSQGYNLGLALTHAERGPSAAELFSVGPHIGTGSYEVGALFEIEEEGDEYHLEYHGNAEKEVSNNLDLSLRKHEGQLGFVLNFFYNQVSDYYYQRDTGITTEDLFAHHEEGEADEAEAESDEHGHDDALPVFIFEQADASFYGVEAEVVWQVAAPLKWTIWGDSIRGELDDGGNLPRIPPARIGNQLNFQLQQWEAELSLVNYLEQDKVAENETITEGYTLVDAQVSYRFDLKGGEMTLFAKATNLTDEEARVHSSFLKDRAPLPGRGFSLGLRSKF